jgi:glycosyltransferase involved in cell wall biosynthesis
MRICLVSSEFAPFSGAGIGTYASLMAAAWAGSGHEVHVLTGPHVGVAVDGPRLRPGVRFHIVGDARPGRVGIGTGADQYSLRVLSALERLHAAHPFDYIEFPDYGGEGAYATWARRAAGTFEGAVLGVRLHTPSFECRILNDESWFDEQAARVETLEDGSIVRADVLISPSASLLKMARSRLGGGAGWPREAVVPYPFDASAVRELTGAPMGARAPADGSERRSILYFGRLEQRKGVQLLVHAWRRMIESGVDVRLRFIGGDTQTGPGGTSMRAHLVELAGPEARDWVTFDPPRPRKELGEAVRAATVVCVPSLWENFPNVMLEAMSLGAVVVGSDTGGIAEVIRDGVDGLLFCAGDAADLERVLRQALADEPRRRDIAAAAPARIAEVCEPATVVASTIAAVEAARPARRARGAVPGITVVVAMTAKTDTVWPTLESVMKQSRPPSDCVVLLRGGEGPWRDAVRVSVTSAAVEEVGAIGPGAARNAILDRIRGSWVVVIEPGDVLEPEFLERVGEAIARNPDAAWIAPLVGWDRGGGLAPVGFDRDLLAAGPGAGLGVVSIAAVRRVGGWDGPILGEEWLADWEMSCRLAIAGEEAVVIPDALIRRPWGRGAGPPPVEAAARVLAAHPRLAARPDRPLRIIAARAAAAERAAAGAEAERRRLAEALEACGPPGTPPGPRRAIHVEAVQRQRMMEENLRYRVADRISLALRALGVQRPLKAAVGRARVLRRLFAGL